MENNLNNKAKFFAQYWDQPILKPSPYVESLHKVDAGLSIHYAVLMLKPLSSITDEDAIEVANILTIDKEDLVLDWKQEIIEILSSEFATTANSLHRFSHACDWLRSKSYTLPYMGLSVETMIEYGWLKLQGQS